MEEPRPGQDDNDAGYQVICTPKKVNDPVPKIPEVLIQTTTDQGTSHTCTQLRASPYVTRSGCTVNPNPKFID